MFVDSIMNRMCKRGKSNSFTRQLPAFCLETRVKTNKKRMIWSLLKDMFFCLNPINILFKKHKQSQHKLLCNTFGKIKIQERIPIRVISWSKRKFSLIIKHEISSYMVFIPGILSADSVNICNSIHTCLGGSLIKHNRAYFWVNMHWIILLYAVNKITLKR